MADDPQPATAMVDFATADPDTFHDLGWFEEHPNRRYYARTFTLAGTRWTALIYRATRLRPARRQEQPASPAPGVPAYVRAARAPAGDGSDVRDRLESSGLAAGRHPMKNSDRGRVMLDVTRS